MGYDTGRPTFVFTGTMDYPPNVDAVRWFANDILPIIRRTLPDAAFYIVGNSPSPAVQALTTIPDVHVTGRVPDVRPYLAHATAAVAEAACRMAGDPVAADAIGQAARARVVTFYDWPVRLSRFDDLLRPAA